MMDITDYKLWLIMLLQVLGFIVICLKLYVKSYSSEKGKNLATKEDISEITEIVESIKASLSNKTEELKSDLSYKNEHLIHLRSSERLAIINYYKAIWVLVLNFSKTDLIKYEVDNFDEENDEASNIATFRYVSDGELILNKIKKDISNLKYLRDISESELTFFYDKPELAVIISELNLSLSAFERALIRSINLLLQVFKETAIRTNSEQSPKEIIIDAKRKRSVILANWYEDRDSNFSYIRTLNSKLKDMLHKRLMQLTF